MVNYVRKRRPVVGGDRETGLPVLWHLEVSPYNEKARWALDYKRVAHIRRSEIPGRHVSVARRLSGKRTFPVLALDGEVYGDSTDIVAALERRYPEPPLYPADPLERRRALGLEEFFDEQFAPYERQLILHLTLAEPDLFLGTFAPGLAGLRRSVARAAFPAIRRRTVADFGLDERALGRAWEKCRAGGVRFAAELGARDYLVGDRFTLADLSVASMFAPAVAPQQFPYPQPQRGHPRLAELRALLDENGVLEWTRMIYARHRPPSSEVRSPPAR